MKSLSYSQSTIRLPESINESEKDSIPSSESESDSTLLPYCYFLQYAKTHDPLFHLYLVNLKLKIKNKLYSFRLILKHIIWPDEVITNIISYLFSQTSSH
jgi:hypothetical protein